MLKGEVEEGRNQIGVLELWTQEAKEETTKMKAESGAELPALREELAQLKAGPEAELIVLREKVAQLWSTAEWLAEVQTEVSQSRVTVAEAQDEATKAHEDADSAISALAATKAEVISLKGKLTKVDIEASEAQSHVEALEAALKAVEEKVAEISMAREEAEENLRRSRSANMTAWFEEVAEKEALQASLKKAQKEVL